MVGWTRALPSLVGLGLLKAAQWNSPQRPKESTETQASCSPQRHEDAKNRKGFLRVFVARFFWLRLRCAREFVANKTATNSTD